MKKLLFIVMVLSFVVSVNAGPTVSMSWTSGGDYPYSPYYADFGGGNVIETFCVERDSAFNKATYEYTIDDDIMFSPDPSGVKPLTDPTRKIYSAYLNGELASYDAIEVQIAVWLSVGENVSDVAAIYQADGLYIYNNIDSFDTSGYGKVKVLNLWSIPDGLDVQSHLIRVPAPGAILLAGLGTSLVGYVRRRNM